MDLGSFLTGAGSVVVIWTGAAALFGWRALRRAPRVTVERDVPVASRTNPPDRYHVWGADSRKRYVVIRVENMASKPFLFLRGKIERDGADPIRLVTRNEGVELLPREATHFHFESEQMGDLHGARLTIYSHGWCGFRKF